MLAATPSTDLAVRCRAAVESDMRYVVATWRESWWSSNANRRLVGSQYHDRFDRIVLGGILAEPDTRVLIGCDEADPDTIVAYAVYTPGIPTLHWLYVREAHPATGEYLRRRGLAGVLATAMGVREGSGIAYTFRPTEHAHRRRKRHLGMEAALLEAAKARRVAVSYVPAHEFLSPRR